METQNQLKIPQVYLQLIEDARLLKLDENNPNRMTLNQREQVWKSLQKYGWTYPIITNIDGLLADGEQRVQVCLEHEEFFVPVLRLPVNDVDRRMLRQILNKLKGKHDKAMDEDEFSRIVDVSGNNDDLKGLLESVGERLPEDLDDRDFSLTIPETYEIIVECRDEAHQKQVFEKLKLEGYKLRILTL
jgi:hypothetical protein